MLSPTRPYLHLVPIEPGECLPSWILRIANRDTPNFRCFSSKWLSDNLRVSPGFDAFPAASLLIRLGAIRHDELDHYITNHTLLGTTKCFYTEAEWKYLITTHGREGSRIYALRQKTKQQSWHICRSCRREELNRGTPNLQVFPQIPGMLYCPKHLEPLVMHTATRIPPYAAPSAKDLPPEMPAAATPYVDHKEDHLALVRDVADALAAGLGCLKPDLSLRDAIAQPLFGGPWPPRLRIMPVLVERFGEPFLDTIQVRTYHQFHSCRARLHPSFHGIVYLAVLARAFGTTLPGLLDSACRPN